MRVQCDRRPEPLDVVVRVEQGPEGVSVFFEHSRRFYARHMLSMPKALIGMALKIAWKDFKGLCLGAERVSSQDRVSDTLETW